MCARKFYGDGIMKVAVIGTGYVGLVSGACLADVGHFVICVDVNEKKVNMLKEGIVPIYEPGLERIVRDNYALGRLDFTADIEKAVNFADICFIAVGTPMGEDGSADLKYVLEVAKNIGRSMDHHICVVNKSTVPVGTYKKVRETIQAELDRRGSDLTFDVVSNPEFLKEGSAVLDFRCPDRIVVGADSYEAADVMRELYAPCIDGDEDKMILMDIPSAEMTKYAANCMLATKISFINEIANICEYVGADVNAVRKGIGSDSRIGYSFINPGCGYGGSCFPKDVQALIRTSKDVGYEPRILQSVESVNETQKLILADRVIGLFGNDLRGKTFAVWGLAFKPNTDDMRCAASVTIIEELTSKGAKIRAYDPKAMDEAREFYLRDNASVEYCNDKYSALDDSEALLVITEWDEFADPDFALIKEKLTFPVIIDGRNIYSEKKLLELGIHHYQIGVNAKKS